MFQYNITSEEVCTIMSYLIHFDMYDSIRLVQDYIDNIIIINITINQLNFIQIIQLKPHVPLTIIMWCDLIETQRLISTSDYITFEIFKAFK